MQAMRHSHTRKRGVGLSSGCTLATWTSPEFGSPDFPESVCVWTQVHQILMFSVNADDAPSVRARAICCCVINLGVSATFVSTWE